MLVNIFFDEENKDLDVIDIPQVILDEIDNVQKMFFKWLFNKTNNHRYWVYIDGNKKYCSYRADAFVEWINNYYILDSSEKAKLIHGADIDESRPRIKF